MCLGVFECVSVSECVYMCVRVCVVFECVSMGLSVCDCVLACPSMFECVGVL